jgi:hypothetical protein
MLHYTRMPKVMWNFAVLARVYLLNRSPHIIIVTTPYQQWTGRLPDLSNISVFGTASLVHVHGYHVRVRRWVHAIGHKTI